ncbi:hypothetical protein [Massilia suwonensis]|uniref:Uncharacterized protein n=1 Tax=Massilia suwonensis TaxID=648895 RepID=A0ABW0MJN9_9BURK
MTTKLLAARAARCLCAAGIAMLAASPGGVMAQPISPAEVLLFETDHLPRMQAPATLVYEFRKLSNVEPAFTDSVQLDVSRAKGQVHAALRFLTGARMHTLPDVDDAHGNPVLLGFLEHDIAEMRRLTGGSVTYFRKRIRMALANAAKVSPQRITYQGKTVEGKAVRIQPYLDDPMRARFENYVRKTYTFVLSDEVPGGIYQISTSLASTGAERPGTVVARAAAGGAPPGTAQPATAAPQGAAAGTAAAAAAPGAKPGTAASGQAKPGAGVTAPAGTAPGRTGPPGAAAATAQARPGAPGAAAPGAATPVIDETLTLVKVVSPQR